MADPEQAAPAPEAATEVDAGAIDRQSTPDLVKKIMHQIETDDMFVQGG